MRSQNVEVRVRLFKKKIGYTKRSVAGNWTEHGAENDQVKTNTLEGGKEGGRDSKMTRRAI